MKLVNIRMHVMSAEAFDLATKVVEDGKIKLYHSRYTRPKTILYNKQKQCIIPLKGSTSEGTNMIFVPSEARCDVQNHKTKDQYWTTGQCEVRERIDPHEIIQIKHSPQYNYIYCASLNITTYNRTMSCLNDVFVLPSNQSFKIEDLTYDSQQLNLHSELHFIPEWKYRVNHQLDPLMRQKLYNSYFAKLNLSINDLNDNLVNRSESFIENPHKYGNILMIGLIVIICVLFFVLYKRKTSLLSAMNAQNYALVSKEMPSVELNAMPL
jgi:hypothetical protein